MDRYRHSLIIIFAFLFLPAITNYFEKDSINLLVWSGVFDPEHFKQFEQESGIRVNVTYFSSHEEVLIKLLATKSKGYDLLVTSELGVEFLIERNLIKKIDKDRLTFFDKLNPKFLNHYFDPNNQYSIPEDWYVLGIGVNKKFFKKGLPPANLGTIFDSKIMPNHIGMTNDAKETIALASLYLFGQNRPLNQKEVEQVKQLLITQKQKVEAYTDFRGDFLLESGNCPIALVATNYIWRELQEENNLAFLLPKEAVVLNIENFVIPVATEKDDYIYKLLNFLYRPEIQKHNFENFSFCPVLKDADYMFKAQGLQAVIPYIHPESPEQALIAQSFLTDEQLNEILLAVKGS